MWFLAQRFVRSFADEARRDGWEIDFVEDDEFAMFARRRSRDLQAELGVDLTQRDFGLSLNPSLSVRNVVASDLTARFFGFDRGAAPVGASLSDLVRAAGGGAGVMWTIAEAHEAAPMVRRVLSDVGTFGESFYSRYESLHDIIGALEVSAKSALELGQLAVAYALAGNSNKAEEIIARVERLSSEQPVLLATQTNRFLSAFRAHFRTGG